MATNGHRGTTHTEAAMAENRLAPALSRRWLTVLNGVVLFAALAGLTIYLWRQREYVTELVASADGQLFLLAFLGFLVFVITQVRVSVGLLKDLGGDLPTLPAMRVFLTSLLGKYLPGKVWIVGMRAAFLKQHSVAIGLTLNALLLENLLLVSSALLLWGIASLVAIGAHPAGLSIPLALLAFAPVVCLVLAPTVLSGPAKAMARLFDGRAEIPKLGISTTAKLAAQYTATWLMLGSSIWLLAGALGYDLPVVTIPYLSAHYGLSVIAGFVAVFAPAGIGVREAVFVFATRGLLSAADSFSLALAARLLTSLAELLATGMLSFVKRTRSPR